MLLLNHAKNVEFAGFDQWCRCFVPHGQYSAATSSPGRKVNQQQFLAAVIGELDGLAITNTGAGRNRHAAVPPQADIELAQKRHASTTQPQLAFPEYKACVVVCEHLFSQS